MAGERNGDRIAALDTDSRLETIKADAFVPGQSDEVKSLVEMHLKISARCLREGAPGRAFAELVRAGRAVPMTSRLASAMVQVSLRAGTEAAAVLLLGAGVEDADGDERIRIRRQLVRLLRRTGELERAREALVITLAERPADRRARQVLNALLASEGRWEELDASLEKEVKESLRRGALKRAARASLRRARVWGERLSNPGHAALRYGQAAQYAEQAKDLDTAFSLRLLWLRALRDSQAPERALAEAVQICERLGDRVGKGQRARTVGVSAVGKAPTGDAPARRSTQVELVAAAEEAEAKGNKPEAAALLAAAVKEGPDPTAHRKLEAHYVARRAWGELAQYYRDRAGEATEPTERADVLHRLAELLEDELHDGAGAAKVYGELVQATGDKGALAEQVRLLSSRSDASGVRRALDEAVERAAEPAARADALVARGESSLARRELEAARQDFRAALQAAPKHLGAHAGLAEASPKDRAAVLSFRDALAAAPRRHSGRGELYRRLARLAEPLADPALLKAAWAEVVAELPGDQEAEGKLGKLARELGDHPQLGQLLRAQLEREPRGPPARRARLELVGLLERTGKMDEAVAELRQAVRFEPGHKEAWLALADRLTARGQNLDAAWALEQGATATEDEAERLRTWEKLARFTRDTLKDDAKAAVYSARVDNMRKTRASGQPVPAPGPAPLGGPLTIPAPPKAAAAEVTTDEGSTPVRSETEEFEAVPTNPEPEKVDEEEWEGSTVGLLNQDEGDDEEGDDGGEELGTDDVVTVNPDEDVMEVATGDVEPPSQEWDAPPGDDDRRSRTEEIPVALGDPDQEIAPSIIPPIPPQRLTEERERLFQQVRDNPLESDGYRLLAEYFDNAGDPNRCGLMVEIANALDGDPNAAPRAPRLICSATDRAGLRHPALRGEAGELLSLAGLALCRLFPVRGRAAGSKEEFRLDSGRGGQATADALLTAVRILGLRAPEIFLSEDNGPPFALVYANVTRVLIGRLAVKRQLPEAELRFFAGRALFTQNPDLLVLRSLNREHLTRALGVLGAVLRGGKALNAEGRAVRDALPRKGLPRLKELFETRRKSLDLSALADGARHSANRAGLIVCGGVAPALAALKAKKALPSEVVELVRFSASERYLQLRSRRLGAG